jgi:ADP-ribosyl-[dinitrogen reductase] hydrolase
MPLDIELDRAVGALVGLAVGDALGTTLEFAARDSRPPLDDIVGGGPFRLEPGQWTDDTSMALCLADSLIYRRGFDGADLMSRFVNWWRWGYNSATGACFDIGMTTTEALARFERTGDVFVGAPDPEKAGNGSLMRLAPAAIFAAGDAIEAERLADLQSRTTHPASVAHDGCRFFARLLTEAMAGSAKEDVLRSRAWDGSPEICHIADGAWKTMARSEISSSGYVVHTLEAALWCVSKSTSFDEAVLLAVNLGDDADTVGAVTGQLAGAIWGRSGIRPSWVATLAWSNEIADRAEALLTIGSSRIVV